MRRRAAQRGDRLDHLAAGALDETCGLDLALQIFRRDFGPKRIDAGVERDHGYE